MPRTVNDCGEQLRKLLFQKILDKCDFPILEYNPVLSMFKYVGSNALILDPSLGISIRKWQSFMIHPS